MKGLIDFIFYRTDIARIFGWFHIASFIIVLGACIFAGIYGKKFSDKNFRKALLIVWIVLIIGEIYRELAFGLSLDGDRYVFNYAWFVFPFQLCSSPLYALPFVIFLPEGKIRDGFMAFLVTFSFFGGVTVMFYPGDVFYYVVGVSIQAMVHHGSQVFVGILTVSHVKERLNRSFYLKGGAVLLGFMSVAMILNISVYHILRANGLSDTFNMYFISPYFPTTLPILSSIQSQGAPYPVVVLIYVCTLLLAATLIALAQHYIVKALSERKKTKVSV